MTHPAIPKLAILLSHQAFSLLRQDLERDTVIL